MSIAASLLRDEDDALADVVEFAAVDVAHSRLPCFAQPNRPEM
jgi:hypothetical protein